MTILSRRLGPYQIVSSLGSGGMGEVYRARDTRLGRDVAIKVLPAALASHPERLRRFEREARAASALNHPNIVTLYDVGREDGIDFLVMELVEGETLAGRLARGPLPLDQVLVLGEQICLALGACHQKGLVHRDLKPGNVMMTGAGVKLLDFGLARALEPISDSISSSAPTGTSPLTREGVVVGTLPYMAPEQLQGETVDARCDLFAFGAVLYEAVTGRRAFAGDTGSAVSKAILTTYPPPASTLAPACPRSLDRLIRCCLEKDRERRFRSAHDLALQLSVIADGEVSDPETPARRSRRLPTWIAGALVLALIGVVLSGIAVRDFTRGRPASVERPVRFPLAPPPGAAFITHFEGPVMAVSPEGSRIAFVASEPESPPRVWVRKLAEIEPRVIEGTENVLSLFWSPDGRSIAFFTRSGSLRRVDPSGGAPVTIVSLSAGIGRTGSWGKSEILFSSIQGEGIYRVSPDGGEPEVVLQPDASSGELRTVWPWFLPDGTSFLYVVRTGDGLGHLRIARDGEESKEVAWIDSQTQYVEPGFVVYAKEGVLLAQRFDVGKGRLEGAPFPLAPRVRYFLSTGGAVFATSPDGTLAYRSEGNAMRLSWFDRSGRNLGNVGSAGDYLTLAMSDDGRRVLFDKVREDLGTWDIWNLDLDRGIETRLTSHPDSEFGARWLPGGKSILYSVVRGGPPQIVRRDLAAEGEETVVPGPGFQQAMDVSHDGRTLLFARRNAGGSNLWTLALEDEQKREAVALLPSRFEQSEGRFSPDGRWVASLSNESGRFEVYVTGVDARGEKIQASREGAKTVRWGRGGRELLYLSLDGGLFSVPVSATPELRVGVAELLFQLPKEALWKTFEVTSDGDRFLAIVTESSGDERPATVVLNWPALLER